MTQRIYCGVGSFDFGLFMKLVDIKKITKITSQENEEVPGRVQLNQLIIFRNYGCKLKVADNIPYVVPYLRFRPHLFQLQYISDKPRREFIWFPPQYLH